MRPQGVLVLSVTVLLATIAFGIGAALEKATLPATSTPTSTGEAVGSSEVGGESHAATSETVLGIDPESIPLISGAVLASLALASAIWLYWRRAVILWIAAAAMFAFGALDVIEIVHQLAVQHPTLVAVAAVVAVLHVLAAILAIRLVLRRTAMEPAVA